MQDGVGGSESEQDKACVRAGLLMSDQTSDVDDAAFVFLYVTRTTFVLARMVPRCRSRASNLLTSGLE